MFFRFANDSSEAVLDEADEGSVYFDADRARSNPGVFSAQPREIIAKHSLRDPGEFLTENGPVVEADPGRSLLVGAALLLVAAVVVFTPFAIRRGVFLFKKQREDDD